MNANTKPGTDRRQQAIHDLLEQAKSNDLADRRAEQRHPFFVPVNVTPLNGANRCFSAFSRELSLSGIGLLHSVALQRGPVRLRLTSADGSTLQATAEIVWCRPAGEGWFLSGARFTADAERE